MQPLGVPVAEPQMLVAGVQEQRLVAENLRATPIVVVVA
jgi:hypothetical protein